MVKRSFGWIVERVVVAIIILTNLSPSLEAAGPSNNIILSASGGISLGSYQAGQQPQRGDG